MSNGSVIKNAFSRLCRTKDVEAESALQAALESAMDWALLEHDEEHQLHVVLGDNYGWAIIRENKVVKMNVKAPHGRDSEAARSLSSIASSFSGTGWNGILMAGMSNNQTYYSISYEMDIMNSTVDFTRKNFNRFFHKV